MTDKSKQAHTPTAVKCQHTAECALDCNANGRGLWIAEWDTEWFVYYAHDIQPVEDEKGHEIYGAWNQVIAKCDSKANASLIVRACNRDHVFEELLEACKAVLGDLRGWGGCVGRSHGSHSSESAAADGRRHKLKQAITKAEYKS